MPCDNSDYEESDYVSLQADSLEPRHRASLTDKDSSDVLLRFFYDKGKLARPLSNTIASDFGSLNKKTDCHSPEYCKKTSHEQHLIISDLSRTKNFNGNKLLGLTTHNDNDEGHLSCNNLDLSRHHGLSIPFYCQDRNLISMNDLSGDLPKASVSPGVDSKSYPSPFFGANVPFELQENMKRTFINDDFYIGKDINKDFYSNPDINNKASSLAAHTQSLSMYNSMASSVDHLQSQSKAYLHFDTCSSLMLPALNSSWPSDVMIKSSPELSSYFSHCPVNRSPAIYKESTSSMPFDLSQGKRSVDTDHSPHSSSTPNVVKLGREFSRESSHLSTSSLTIGKIDTLGMRETDSCSSLSPGFIIKTEDESLSPRPHTPHHLSSPYRSTSLSPWPVSSNFGHSNEALGSTIQDKKKCASDSSLYLPTMVQTSPSPPTSSSRIAKEEAVTVECRWNMCTQTFTSQRALAQHVNDCHVRIERPDIDFQCHWQGCPRQGKGFNARYKMLIHIRTHTNEKPHKCAVCRKCFSRLENLKIHMRSHTGEKPYACTFPGCTKAYSNSSDRFKHVRTHQEEKPYKCKMAGCHKQYTDPSSLRKHVRTHGHGTTANQTPLQHSANKGNELQLSDVKLGRRDTNSTPFSNLCVDIHSDFNKGIKMDAERQMSQDLNKGRLDIRDIQRNIELYSSLEVKGGVQAFGQGEDRIQDEFQPVVLRKSLEMAKEDTNLSTDDDVFEKTASPLVRRPMLSVPSIVIEDSEDCSKSVENLPSSGKELDISELKRKRSDSLDVVHNLNVVKMSRREEYQDDLRKSFKGEDLIAQPKNCEKSSSSVGKDCPTNQSTTSALSSPSSHPKHWKKRKILDEENLQRQQQQQKEEEVKKLEKSNEVLCDEKSRAQSLPEAVTVAHSIQPSPDTNPSIQLSRPFDSPPCTVTAKGSETISPSSEAFSPPQMSLITSEGHLYSPTAPYYPSVYCPSLVPCSYNPVSGLNPHPPATFISPSLFAASYPDLHPAATNHNFLSSKFDPHLHHHSLSAAAATSAVFFPKAAKACSHLYFPYLSTLMDLSSGLNPLTQHHPHLSHMSLTPHPMAVESPASMICPLVCPPASRTLP